MPKKTSNVIRVNFTKNRVSKGPTPVRRFSGDPASSTLAASRVWLEQQRGSKEGAECPCCGRYDREYDRVFTDVMAQALVEMYKYWKRTGEEWVNLPQITAKLKDSGFSGGDPVKSKHYELIEAWKGVRPDGSKKTGWYRLTEKGIYFVEGKISIPKRFRLYRNKLLWFSKEEVFLTDVLPSFNYDEMMSR